MNLSSHAIGYHILRLGLAALFLWFGFSQLFDSPNWVGWVPEWATNLSRLSPAAIVFANGTFEIAAGSLIALGLFVRPAAVLLSLHLVLIAFDIGFNDIGIRDYGLAAATLALAFFREREAAPAPTVFS